jgi:peptide deformylase
MLEVIKHPNDILRQISEPVKLPLSREDRKLIDDMYKWVKENSDKAVGLSAIQIGIPKRMCAIRYVTKNSSFSYKLINPEIVRRSSGIIIGSEGCLSVEDTRGLVSRSESVTVTGFDAITNKKVRISASGFKAVILQHEIDHMDGILYIDKLVEEDN